MGNDCGDNTFPNHIDYVANVKDESIIKKCCNNFLQVLSSLLQAFLQLGISYGQNAQRLFHISAFLTLALPHNISVGHIAVTTDCNVVIQSHICPSNSISHIKSVDINF